MSRYIYLPVASQEIVIRYVYMYLDTEINVRPPILYLTGVSRIKYSPAERCWFKLGKITKNARVFEICPIFSTAVLSVLTSSSK